MGERNRGILNEKIWDNDVIDNIPWIVSEALGKSICVVRIVGEEVSGYNVFNEERGEGIVVALKSQHYWRIKGFKKQEKEKKDFNKTTIVLQYVSEKVNRSIKKAFKSLDIDCNLCFKARRIYEFCETQSKRKREENEIKHEGVVYRMECRKCKQKGIESVYTGETGRKLEVRMKEHNYKNKDEMKRTETLKHS